VKLTIVDEPFDSVDAQRLIGELDRGLAELYTPDQRFGPKFKAAQIADGRAVFLVARADGRAVGCGAIQLLEDTKAEVKRMYVEPGVRGTGVGRKVLDALELRARELGVETLVLETGVHQHAAIALYLHAGFVQCDCWGEYLTAATSVCYSKELVKRGDVRA
jgi:putative acetyltransferase